MSPSGPGIRRDSGMYEGWTVPIEYDPLLAKLIGYGRDRASRPSPRLDARAVRIFRRRHQDQHFAVPAHPGGPEIFARATSTPGILDRLLAASRSCEREAAAIATVAADSTAIAAGMFAALRPRRPARAAAMDATRPNRTEDAASSRRRMATGDAAATAERTLD